MSVVGSLPWLRAQPKDMPLYFDRGLAKRGASGVRYHEYSSATTLGEYMRLNVESKWVPDFKYDFAKGHLRSLPSAALMSISPGERAAVHSVVAGLPSEPVTIEACASLWADHVFTVGTRAGLIPEPTATPTDGSVLPEGIWAPCRTHATSFADGISPDALHDCAERLAAHVPEMGAAIALEHLDSGSNSPPQVGGGLIDELTSFGYATHRLASFSDVSEHAVRDRALSPAAPFPADDIARLAPLDPDDAHSDGCLFVSASQISPSPLDPVVFTLGATEFRNLSSLRPRDDWHLWEPTVRKEVEHAILVKRALTFRSNAEMRAARRQHADVFEIINLVTPCVIKHDANGIPVKRKFRITAADAVDRPNSKFTGERPCTMC